MPIRVHNLAKELGVKSKEIIERCHFEGVPDTLVKNHMSTVSVGLAHTIREWFGADPLFFEGRELEFVINPGNATPQEVGQLLYEISKLYKFMGGSGVTFRPSESRELERVFA